MKSGRVNVTSVHRNNKGQVIFFRQFSYRWILSYCLWLWLSQFVHLNIFQTARRLILLFKLPSRWTGFSWLTCPGVGLYPAGKKSEPQVERLTLVPKPWRYVRSELSGNWNVTLPGLFPGVTDPGYAGLSGVPGVWNIRLSAPGVLSSALSITPGDAGVSWDNRRKHKKFIAEIRGSRHFAHERLTLLQ